MPRSEFRFLTLHRFMCGPRWTQCCPEATIRTRSEKRMRHGVLGSGGVGGLNGAVLADAGEEVTLIVRPGTESLYPREISLTSPFRKVRAAVLVTASFKRSLRYTLGYGKGHTVIGGTAAHSHELPSECDLSSSQRNRPRGTPAGAVWPRARHTSHDCSGKR